MKFATAKTELESFSALECWVKLKSSIVLPLKAGKQRKSATHKFHERQMLIWLAGDNEDCWKRETLLKKKYSQKHRSDVNRKDKAEGKQADIVNLEADELSKEEK